jgi:hypothetical protein
MLHRCKSFFGKKNVALVQWAMKGETEYAAH